MTAAIFGLAGVIVGAFVQGWVSFVLERRRENVATVSAARLLLVPLSGVLSELSFAVSAKKTWPLVSHASEELEQTWRDHRPLLASTLPVDDWNKVMVACDAALSAYLIRRSWEAQDQNPDDALPESWVGDLKHNADMIQAGCDALREAAESAPRLAAQRGRR
jgi:hypothetical protein